jgi:hypothetical protein
VIDDNPVRCIGCFFIFLPMQNVLVRLLELLLLVSIVRIHDSLSSKMVDVYLSSTSA